jgi:NADH-ubiquinone oxidoreductase chain 2
MILTSILFLLLSNAVTLRRDMSILYNRIAIIALAYSILHVITGLFTHKEGIGLHGGLLQTTSLIKIFSIFIFIICILILQLTSFYPRKLWIAKSSSLKTLLFKKIFLNRSKIINKMGDHLKIIEYPLILLFVISGAVFLMSTNDLISIFLSIELQSYGLYLLSTIYRNSELSTTGGLIYFLLGGLSSCFILLGLSLLYVNSGTTSLDSLYIINSINNYISGENILPYQTWYNSYYIDLSLLIFSIGFLFKVSAAPFHFWSPDVYDAIPTIVTTFVAIIAKISIFIFLLELVYYTTSSSFLLESVGMGSSWTLSLLISSLLSLIIGTIGGLTQFRIKRLFAYSTISHVGFILLALSISSIESIQAFIFYIIQYSISNLNAFIILITMGFSLYSYISDNKEFNNLLEKNNSPIQLISQLRGYFYINPFLSLSLAITIFSFAGIPPLTGFFAKQMVLSAALDNGYYFLALIAILTSVIGGVYYLNVIKEIFFFNSPYKINSINSISKINNKNESIIDTNVEISSIFLFNSPSKINSINSISKINNKNESIINNNVVVSSPMAITISVITLIILLFIFINKEWLSMGTILVQILFST